MSQNKSKVELGENTCWVRKLIVRKNKSREKEKTSGK